MVVHALARFKDGVELVVAVLGDHLAWDASRTIFRKEAGECGSFEYGMMRLITLVFGKLNALVSSRDLA